MEEHPAAITAIPSGAGSRAAPASSHQSARQRAHRPYVPSLSMLSATGPLPDAHGTVVFLGEHDAPEVVDVSDNFNMTGFARYVFMRGLVAQTQF